MRTGTFQSGRAFLRYGMLLLLMSIVSIGTSGCKSGWTRGNPFAPKPKPASTKTPAEIDGVQLTPPPEKYSRDITKKEDKKNDTSLAQKGKYEKYQSAKQEEVAQVAMNTNTRSTVTSNNYSTGSAPGFNVPGNNYQGNASYNTNPTSSMAQNSTIPKVNGNSAAYNTTPSGFSSAVNNQSSMNTGNQYANTNGQYANTNGQYANTNGQYGVPSGQSGMSMPNQTANVQAVPTPQPTVYNNIPLSNNNGQQVNSYQTQSSPQSLYANNTQTGTRSVSSVPFPTINRSMAATTANTTTTATTNTTAANTTVPTSGATSSNWPATGIYGTTPNTSAVPAATQGTPTGTGNAFAPGSIGGF